MLQHGVGGITVMHRTSWLLVTSVMIGVTGTLFAAAPAKNTVPIGTKIDSLEFKDTWFLSRSLADFGEKKAIVLVFTNSKCPVVARYMPKLRELNEQFAPRGVQFALMNVDPEDSIIDAAHQAILNDLPFPVLKDFEGDTVRALGVRYTPEVVVLDGNHSLAYRGRIDASIRVGGNSPKRTREDLREAIEDVLAGKKVRVAETPVDGCRITLPTTEPRYKDVNYAEHIAAIMQRACTDCHHPNAEAPFSLMTFEDVRARGDMIAEVVRDQRMPPWYAPKDFNQAFQNCPTLSTEEKQLVADWVKLGMPAGDLAKAPPPKEYLSSQWTIGEPDLVITALQQHELPATGYINYKYLVLPHMFTHDTWVQGFEILPDNPRVVHHCNMAYAQLGKSFSEGNFITGRIPGGQAMNLRHNVGFMIPAGSVLVLQIHYTTTGQPENCRISVGLRFPREVIHRRLQHVQVSRNRFEVPPNDPHFKLVSSKTIDCDAELVGMFSHMHLRGKHMSFFAHYPGGETETLLAIPNYSFDWQLGYEYARNTKKIPKGTRVECVAHFDNSAFNPYNPDADATVVEGAQTFNEMMFGFVFYTDESEYLDIKVDPKTGRPIDKSPPGEAPGVTQTN